MSAVSSQSSRCPRTKKVVRRSKLPHQSFPAQQHALRLVHTLIATPSCSGLPIPLARLEIWGHLARRPGRRAHRPTHARGDLAPRPLPLYTQTLSRRPDGGTAEPHLRGSRRPTSTTSATMSRAGRRRSILGSLLAEKAKKPSLRSSYGSKNRKCFSSPPTREITANRPLTERQFCCAKLKIDALRAQ